VALRETFSHLVPLHVRVRAQPHIMLIVLVNLVRVLQRAICSSC
jgi:hypothetical protein